MARISPTWRLPDHSDHRKNKDESMTNFPESSQILLMVGTRKGGFIFTSDPERINWMMSELLFKSWNVTCMSYDPRHQRIHAAVVHDAYGPSTHYTDDLGKTWKQARFVPSFPRPTQSGRPLGTPDEVRKGDSSLEKPEEVKKVWEITPGRVSEPGVLYAGIEPAALFKTTDNGETWQINESLYDHPHRPEWFPGAGGLGLHTILLDPDDPERMHVAISTGGCYRSDDNGLKWKPRNENVRADFLPNHFPAFGQCVHRMVMHPSKPNILYQQNHCGVYRSDNYGDSWVDIGDGKLPSRFGFPIAISPADPDTIFVVLEESDEYRISIDGSFVVWRSQNGGLTWQALDNGLPDKAYLVVLRQSMAVDGFESTGVYIGTSTGQLFYSRDNGNHWQLLADFLPPILSVQTAILPSKVYVL